MRLLLIMGLLTLFGRSYGLDEVVQLPTVQDSYGKTVNLAEVVEEGSYVLLWFFPKSLSPGCSAQGKRYADLYEDFQKLNVQVFGVSSEPGKEQCEFIEKLALKGGMLPDKGGALAKTFKVGGIFGFYNRDTVLINPQSRIERVWRNVNPFKDADMVLEYMKGKK
jgi:peroxiredoxin Q/BCP